jgi:hypothetical protein
MGERSEPVFAAPLVSSVMKIEPQWIDYNGHLNVAYYNVLFDRAVDEVYELIGLGPAYLERHTHSSVRGAQTRDRKLGIGDLGEHDLGCRHDGQESRAVSRQRPAPAQAHASGARGTAAAGRRWPQCPDAGQALTACLSPQRGDSILDPMHMYWIAVRGGHVSERRRITLASAHRAHGAHPRTSDSKRQ